MTYAPSPSMRLSIFLAVVLLSFAELACRSETERLFAEAARAEADDDYEGAARRLREIVIGHPQSPFASRARLQLARIHLQRTRDVPTAHARLLEILDESPESPVALPAHHLLARLYERDLQEPERALPHYRAVLEGEEDIDIRRDALLSLGECHYRLEQLEEAAAAYRMAAALPHVGSTDAAYFRLATLSRAAGDPVAALRWLEELESRTNDASRRYAAILGQVETLMTLGRFDEARGRLEAAERLSPGAPESDELLARLDSAQAGPPATEGGRSDSPESLEQRIHWGSGRVPRRQR